MKFIFSALFVFQIFATKSQALIVKVPCADTLSYITNAGDDAIPCEFFFKSKYEGSSIFYVEDFSHMDFYNTVFKNDQSKIKRVKAVTADYTPSAHHFIFTYNSHNFLMYYYAVSRAESKDLSTVNKLLTGQPPMEVTSF